MKALLHILLILISLSLLLLQGCIEDEDDLISQQECSSIPCAMLNGMISTGDGHEPFQGAEIEVLWKNTVYLGGGTIRTKARGQTNEDGYYEINFRVREDELEDGYFLVKIFIDSNFLSCGNTTEYHDFSISQLSNDSIVTTHYGIPYKAFLSVHANGASQMADNDYLSFTATSPAGIDFQGGCGTVISWTNQNPDETYLIEVAAFQPVIVSTTTRKGEERTN
ncbi:MAG: hypothetical protein AAF519_20465, partial [Bacteroidota bacterium]